MQTYIGEGLEEIVSYCKMYCEEESILALKVAKDVLAHRFLFESKWEMERTYDAVTFEGDNIGWDLVPFGDPEWMYAMNRHRYFVSLAQAYALTEKEEYVSEGIRLLMHWIEHQPLTDQSQYTTWRTIETGLRCENWIKAYEIFSTSPQWNEEVTIALKESLKHHCEHILAHNDDFRRLSNWGVIENHGLFVAGVFLGNDHYVQVAKERLYKAVQLQVLDDGLHWEQSQLYHNEVLRALVDVGICAKNNGITLAPHYHQVVNKMLEAHIYMTKPNHIQLANGDSDAMDLRDILVRGAYLYENPIYKALGYEKVDFESIWDIGMQGVKVYDNLESYYPEICSKALRESGNYCMRHTWDEDSIYVHFKCGNLGGGHGHVDLLHVDVAYLGEDVLKDQGRYTYTDSKERYSLKSATAHNTVVVDGAPFTKIIDTWGYGKVAPHVQREFVNHELYDYVEGAHLGYMDLDDPVFINRKVIVIKPNIVVLVDEFTAKEEHTYEQYFHFGEGHLEVGEAVTFKGNNVKANLYHLQSIDKKVIEGITSKTYNQLQAQQVLQTTLKHKGSGSIITVMILGDVHKESREQVEYVPVYTEGKKVPNGQHLEAIRIAYEDEKYTLVIKHDETYRRLFVVEGQDVYGRVTLIKQTEDQTKVHTIVG